MSLGEASGKGLVALLFCELLFRIIILLVGVLPQLIFFVLGAELMQFWRKGS